MELTRVGSFFRDALERVPWPRVRAWVGELVSRPRAAWVWGGVLGLLVVGGLISYWMRPVAEVYRVKRGTAIAAVYGTVKVDWLWSISLRAQNTGTVQLAPGIYAGQSAIGIRVKKDQLLATIVDDATLQELRRIRIELEAAENRARLGPPSAEALRNAETNLASLLKLSELNNVPSVQLEQARNEVKRLAEAVANERIELERGVATWRDALRGVQERLKKTEIRSPIDGVLTAINKGEGEVVVTNEALFTVAVNKTVINGEVNEEDVGDIVPGRKAKVRLYAFGDREFEATVDSVAPSGNPDTQRYSVFLHLDNPPPNLMAGMTGEMNILIAKHDHALIIPSRALMGNRVFVVRHGRVEPREVRKGFHSLEKTEIVSGLADDELVVVSDQDLLRPGMLVRPIEVNAHTQAHETSER
ncbi:efflux RND transporter periplasmic adaptor subunit [Candidatus Methylacidithermus pantelleriae]|uniref:RND family efflux transporter, MFP subunit n=1 Tax=Candidatus Methylacidithermus pantelleriae TaxID=2744239 RepID=A0A8J2BKC2_9BACT|nr:efflux RND transporter periplasmic adaptor subunit [Candidatus Methylacidithermus pantelleriae]CAF0689535.1 RND family efflux transporter, MFP subunit [Candidatus Methylacidithermus pantelleriae]